MFSLLDSIKIIEEKYNIPVQYEARKIDLTQPWYNMDQLNKRINTVSTDSMQTINLIYEMTQELPTHIIIKPEIMKGYIEVVDGNHVVRNYRMQIDYGVAYMESLNERRSWYDTDDTVWSSEDK